MAESILTSTKKNLGVDKAYEAFDPDIMLHINSILSVLTQVGIGPEVGFRVEGETDSWEEFIGDDPRLNSVKTYVYLRVRLLFDPPTTSFLLEALTKQYQELEWRLNVTREGTAWVHPDPPRILDEVL